MLTVEEKKRRLESLMTRVKQNRGQFDEKLGLPEMMLPTASESMARPRSVADMPRPSVSDIKAATPLSDTATEPGPVPRGTAVSQAIPNKAEAMSGKAVFAKSAVESQPKPKQEGAVPTTRSVLQPKPELKPEARPELRTAPKPELKAAPKPELKPEVKPALKAAPKPELKPEAKPELKAAPKPEPRPDLKTAPAPKPEPEAKPVVAKVAATSAVSVEDRRFEPVVEAKSAVVSVAGDPAADWTLTAVLDRAWSLGN